MAKPCLVLESLGFVFTLGNITNPNRLCGVMQGLCHVNNEISWVIDDIL